MVNFDRFVTHSLRSPDQALQPDSIDQEESKKFETEFQKFQQQDKAQKDAWVKEHPDAAKKLEEEDEWMELMKSNHSSVKGGMRYNTGKLQMVLYRPLDQRSGKTPVSEMD